MCVGGSYSINIKITLPYRRIRDSLQGKYWAIKEERSGSKNTERYYFQEETMLATFTNSPTLQVILTRWAWHSLWRRV